jgi:hypothetical protein
MICRWRHQDEDGATAVIFAICLFMLMGIAALAVDAGLLWWNRRSLVVDTDAAALAAAGYARDQVLAGVDCSNAGPAVAVGAGLEADAVITENDTDTAFDPLNPAQFNLDCPTSRYGHVTVGAINTQGYAFANVFGNGSETDVFARSHAEFGPLVGADKLRPLPLCVNGTPAHPSAYEAWQSTDLLSPLYLGPTASGHVFKVPIDDDAFAAMCNSSGLSASGGFRWVDFDGDDGGGNGRPCPDESAGGGSDELKTRFEDGYACLVYTHDYDDGTNSGHNCRPDTGGSWETDGCPSGDGVTAASLNCITGGSGCSVDQVCSGWLTTRAEDCSHIWTLLLYDELLPEPELPPSAAANQPRFHPSGFVKAVPRVVQHTGFDKYVGLEFIEIATGSGVIGLPASGSAYHHLLGVRLCGAEDDDNCLD